MESKGSVRSEACNHCPQNQNDLTLYSFFSSTMQLTFVFLNKMPSKILDFIQLITDSHVLLNSQ